MIGKLKLKKWLKRDGGWLVKLKVIGTSYLSRNGNCSTRISSIQIYIERFFFFFWCVHNSWFISIHGFYREVMVGFKSLTFLHVIIRIGFRKLDTCKHVTYRLNDLVVITLNLKIKELSYFTFGFLTVSLNLIKYELKFNIVCIYALFNVNIFLGYQYNRQF